LILNHFLNSAGQKNELIVAVGCMNNLPDTVTNGSHFEKTKYIPGIYDDVKILLSDYPLVQNVQIAPDLKKNSARVVAELLTKKDEELKVDYAVSEVSSGKIIAKGSVSKDVVADDLSFYVLHCRDSLHLML
jgi:beta-galactosidase